MIGIIRECYKKYLFHFKISLPLKQPRLISKSLSHIFSATC